MLQTRHPPAADALVLAPEVALARGRAHEVTGPARVAFALLAAARLDGPVFWLQPAWAAERLMGDGLCGILDPGRLVLGRARTLPALLRAAEEALRAGLVPLVVVELPSVPALTPVRRLHLAAEAGARAGAAPARAAARPGRGRRAGGREPLAPRPRPGLGARRRGALAADAAQRPHGATGELGGVAARGPAAPRAGRLMT